MNRQKRQSTVITICSILLFSMLITGTLWAGPFSTRLPLQKTLPASNKLIPVSTESGDLEIITDLEGRHFWQVPVRNTGSHDVQKFMVLVTFEGFRKEDKVQTSGVIDLLKAGQTAYARAELPDFEGMHLMRIKTGGTTKTVEIPRPFRKDADGNPLKALQIDSVWAKKVGGKIHWYFKTKPNLYAIIKPNQIQYLVYVRERKHKYCHQEDPYTQRISYIDPDSPFGGTVTNPKEIKPGESMIFSGEFNEQTAKPHLPAYVDRLVVKNAFLNPETGAELDQASFYPNYVRCAE